jgi:glycosyltransferase involved in cell wall biosynthesis
LRIGIPLKSYGPAWGGPGTYTEKIVKHLLEIDRENEYILIIPSGKQTGETSWFGGAHPNVHEERTRWRAGILWDQLVVPRVARQWRLDILFSPFQSLPVMGHMKKVMTVHGAERYKVPGMLNWKARAKWSIMENILLSHADAVISVSRTMTQDFCEATNFPKDRVCTTYLGVDEDFSRIEDPALLESVRQRYGLADPFVLFVGHLFPNKNLGNLLRAFHLISSKVTHKLVMVGGRRWRYERDLALIDCLGLADRVRILGLVPRPDLVALYNLASCLVFPSWYESFGLAQLEAMASGCPVVASNTGALPEVAGNAALFCDPRDPQSIAEGIVKLLSDPELRQAYVDEGLAHARQFTWARCAHETLQVLQAVVAGDRAVCCHDQYQDVTGTLQP